ncbi:flagellar basal body P-ring formation chaperone FlgA [Oricola thermophila]|uniref:Flagella basal body P-ring formation protein FlgA n=1 Tax=Oricola thermophila TaxID=2742145 RepID=A0A6N1VGK1_9HYPH|nr:flagellar basal body P-ring formation chaperone FlgA [Oricola thermophila]QKV19643.1 flagellar basal body P-ring formation protein FlgA [Oricola thermophila]
MKRLLRIVGILLPAVCLSFGAAAATENSNVVVTVNRVIYPGQVIPADAVVETRLRRPLASGVEVVRDVESLVGMVAAKTILPKRLIAPSALRDAYAIEAGQPATVYFRQGGLTIAMDGIALQSANIGKPIRVRNIQSGRTIAGIVMPDGTVSVEAR